MVRAVFLLLSFFLFFSVPAQSQPEHRPPPQTPEFYTIPSSVRRILEPLGYTPSVKNKIFSVSGHGVHIESTCKGVLSQFIRGFVLQTYAFQTDKPVVVFDVGMTRGISPIYFSKIKEVVHIYDFEPFVRSYKESKANIDRYPEIAKKITVIPAALSDKDSSRTSTCNLRDISVEGLQGKSRGEVLKDGWQTKIGPLNDIVPISKAFAPYLKKHRKEEIYLRMSCESAEFDLLPELERSGLLKKMSFVDIEWFHGDPSKLTDILVRNGFFCFFAPFHDPNMGQIRAVRIK